jgi:hypothetical protein
MRIGLSYSRCVRDIVEGTVKITDVLVLITRTDFDPNNDSQWADIWQGYCHGGLSKPEWRNWDVDNKAHEALFRNVSLELYNTGKMHQPRQFGALLRRRPETWLESVLPSSELEKNPAVKDAWDQFQTIAALTGVTLDRKYQ